MTKSAYTLPSRTKATEEVKVRKPRVQKIIRASGKRTANQIIAAIAAGFLPVASYVLAHYEVKENQYLAILVAAALLFSAPTLVSWAQRWCGNVYKASGFAILLEGVMIFSSIPALSYTGLAILCAINCHSAYELAAKKEIVKN